MGLACVASTYFKSVITFVITLKRSACPGSIGSQARRFGNFFANQANLHAPEGIPHAMMGVLMSWTARPVQLGWIGQLSRCWAGQMSESANPAVSFPTRKGPRLHEGRHSRARLSVRRLILGRIRQTNAWSNQHWPTGNWLFYPAASQSLVTRRDGKLH